MAQPPAAPRVEPSDPFSKVMTDEDAEDLEFLADDEVADALAEGQRHRAAAEALVDQTDVAPRVRFL